MQKKLLHSFCSFLVSPCRFSLVWVPWLICLGGLLTEVALFYPGGMPPDPVAQFLQAENGIIGDWHPPVMAATWQIVRSAVHTLTGEWVIGNEIMWLFYITLVWFGFLLILSSARTFWQNQGTSQKSYLVVFITAAMLLWMSFDVLLKCRDLLKDVGFLGSYLVVTGCFLHISRTKAASLTSRWIFCIVAVLFLFYGTALRHNAIFAAIPFLCWLVWLVAPQKKLRLIIPAGLILWCSLLAGIHYVNYGVIKAVRLYSLQEIFYQDIFHLNARTNRFMLPPNGFGNDFSRLDEATFRKTFNSEINFVKKCFKNYNANIPTEKQLLFDYSVHVPCYPEKFETENKLIAEMRLKFHTDNIRGTADINIVREQFPKDYEALKMCWLNRISADPVAYLKFHIRFFVNLCKNESLLFMGLNSLILLHFTVILGLIVSFSRHRLDKEVFPCLMLLWSSFLYLAPFLLFLPDVQLRYLYWFFAASLISIVLFCANSEFICSILRQITELLEEKLRQQ
jgi:hypothetical protein